MIAMLIFTFIEWRREYFGKWKLIVFVGSVRAVFDWFVRGTAQPNCERVYSGHNGRGRGEHTVLEPAGAAA
jgi:hypothetical protein